jgi:hypothetical protein
MTTVFLIAFGGASISLGYALGSWREGRRTEEDVLHRYHRRIERERRNVAEADRLRRSRPVVREMVLRPTARDQTESHHLDE